MSIVPPDDQPYRETLVAQLQARCALSARVRDAFRAVPRHLFIDHYFERIDGVWIQVDSAHRSTQQWLEKIYSDSILVTSYTPTGGFQSSSSQPTVMAIMLGHLDVQMGQKILEIGTGTGYNAALLSFLAGTPLLLTSIDIDPGLVAQATLNIEHVVGPGALILAGDGNLGVRLNAPYDRIIATASVPKVPQAWMDQLATGGKLVCILQSGEPPVGGILVAEHSEEGKITGHIVALALFLPMRSHAQGALPDSPQVFQGEKYASFPLDPQFAADRFWSSPHLRFFFSQALPDLTMTITRGPTDETKTLLSLGSGKQGYVAFETQQAVLYGDRSPHIWQRYLELVTLFDNLQQPAVTDYGFENGDLSIQTPHGIICPFLPDD